MKEYIIIVDGRYFVGETTVQTHGYAIAPSGFFQMVRDNTMNEYAYSDRIADASKMILFTALGYLNGIYDRTRYLPECERPNKIVVEEYHE